MKSFDGFRSVEKVKYAVRTISIDKLENEVKKKWLARGVVAAGLIGLTTRKHLRSSPRIDGSARRDAARAQPRPASRPAPIIAMQYF